MNNVLPGKKRRRRRTNIKVQIGGVANFAAKPSLIFNIAGVNFGSIN